MSLINDALKKAQRERTGGAPETTPVPGGGSRPPIEAQRRAQRNPQLALIAGGAIAGMLLAGGAVWFFRPPATPPAAPVTARPASSPAPSTVAAIPTALPAPPLSANLTSAPKPTSVADTPPPVPGPTVSQNATAVAATPPPPGPTSNASTIAPPAAAALRPSLTLAKLAELVDAFRVAGIRAAGTDSKVLLNDRVFRVGDVVDLTHGIRLTGATANSLTFSDPTGLVYTRNF